MFIKVQKTDASTWLDTHLTAGIGSGLTAETGPFTVIANILVNFLSLLQSAMASPEQERLLWRPCDEEELDMGDGGRWGQAE